MPSRRYRLLFAGADERDMMAPFEDGATLSENLEVIIPLAVDRGLLPVDCTVSELRVSHGDQELNLQLPLEGQVEDVDFLVIERIITSVNLRIRYSPDGLDERSETLTVNPYEVLEPQVKGPTGEILSLYRFRGLRRKYYRFLSDGKRISRRRPLATQGIRADAEVVLKPYALLGWPPAVVEYTLAVVLIALLVVVYFRYLAPPTEFRVTFKADVSCRVEIPAEDEAFQLQVGEELVRIMERGDYVLEIAPQEYPLFSEEMTIPSEDAEGDLVFKVIDAGARWRDAEEMKLTVQGFITKGDNPLHARNRVTTALLVNGYPYAPDVGQVVLVLPKGPYDIRFDLDDKRFERAELEQTSWESFEHDFSDYAGAHALLNLFYSDE